MDVIVVLRSKVYPVSLSVTFTTYAVNIPFRSKVGGGFHSKLILE